MNLPESIFNRKTVSRCIPFRRDTYLSTRNSYYREKTGSSLENPNKKIILKNKADDAKLDYFEMISKKQYTYYIGSGNNDKLIRRVMQLRKNDWVQTNQTTSLFVNFKWQQGQRGYKYHCMLENKSYKSVVNHFENHMCITNKQQLFRNLDFYCKKQKLNIFSFIPPTFVLNTSDECCGNVLNNFLQTYINYNPEMKRKSNEDRKKYFHQAKKKLRNFFYSNSQKRNFSKITMNQDVFLENKKNCYLWILKPTFLNRGRGIQVFSDISTLQKIISENIEGYLQKGLSISNANMATQRQSTLYKTKSKLVRGQKRSNSSLMLPENSKDPNIYSHISSQIKNIIKTNAFIVQKYMQNPFLINNRKFDIRIWVLVTHEFKAYFFREGYIRLSSQIYKLDHSTINNQFIHLTNNAVQKHSSNYNTVCQGNQLSFEWFGNYIKNQKINKNFSQVVHAMKNITKISLQAAQKRLDPFNRKFCFQIFGYDFILDKNLNPWLIEVNTNPCLEQSSPLLASLIPRMIDDAFQLTLDVIFPLSKRLGPSPFKVAHYDCNQNMWQFLLSLERKKNRLVSQ